MEERAGFILLKISVIKCIEMVILCIICTVILKVAKIAPDWNPIVINTLLVIFFVSGALAVICLVKAAHAFSLINHYNWLRVHECKYKKSRLWVDYKDVLKNAVLEDSVVMYFKMGLFKKYVIGVKEK